MIYSRIAGTGSYLPEKVVTNKDLEKSIDTSDEWIRDRTGICRRHVAAEGEACSDLAVAAAHKAIEMAGIEAGDHILRYDNQRVYNWRDLRTATTSGDISDVIEVEVDRDGETRQCDHARGPLGIRMDSLSVAP